MSTVTHTFLKRLIHRAGEEEERAAKAAYDARDPKERMITVRAWKEANRRLDEAEAAYSASLLAEARAKYSRRAADE